MHIVTKWTIVFILFSTLFINTPVVDAKTNSITVDTKSLNIRSGPGLSFTVIGALKKGDRVNYIASSDEWYQISVDNGTGWIASWLVTQNNEVDITTPTIVSRVDSLNIRTSPSIGSSILGKMNAGDKAIKIGQNDVWAQIVVNGQNGWVHMDYISVVEGQKEQQPPNQEIDTFTVAVDALNVRKSADLTSKRIGLITKGESYTIKETANNWVRIALSNQSEGWVYSFHGTISSKPTTNETGSTVKKSITVLSNGTNIRESATTESSVIQRAAAGDRLTTLSEVGDWYEVQLSDGKSAFVAKWVVSASDTGAKMIQVDSTNKTRVPGTLKGLTIVIDPGHGGNDRGTTGVRGTDEKNINLLTSELLASKLKAAGANVHLTRETDAYVSLRKRVALSHHANADAFISIHYDATTDASVEGFTTYYSNSRQKELATAVNNGLNNTLLLRNRGAQPGNYLVLRENRQNAILIELGFLSNAGEELKVTTNIFREQATLGIYNGLLNYFNANN